MALAWSCASPSRPSGTPMRKVDMSPLSCACRRASAAAHRLGHAGVLPKVGDGRARTHRVHRDAVLRQLHARDSA